LNHGLNGEATFLKELFDWPGVYLDFRVFVHPAVTVAVGVKPDKARGYSFSVNDFA
jgi:hypothetical protein